MVCTQTDFIKRIEGNGVGRARRLESQDFYVAGYPAIMGLQPLYFRDSELARRARIPAEAAQTKNAGTLLTPEALPRLP